MASGDDRDPCFLRGMERAVLELSGDEQVEPFLGRFLHERGSGAGNDTNPLDAGYCGRENSAARAERGVQPLRDVTQGGRSHHALYPDGRIAMAAERLQVPQPEEPRERCVVAIARMRIKGKG